MFVYKIPNSEELFKSHQKINIQVYCSTNLLSVNPTLYKIITCNYYVNLKTAVLLKKFYLLM